MSVGDFYFSRKLTIISVFRHTGKINKMFLIFKIFTTSVVMLPFKISSIVHLMPFSCFLDYLIKGMPILLVFSNKLLLVLLIISYFSVFILISDFIFIFSFILLSVDFFVASGVECLLHLILLLLSTPQIFSMLKEPN